MTLNEFKTSTVLVTVQPDLMRGFTAKVVASNDQGKSFGATGSTEIAALANLSTHLFSILQKQDAAATA